MRSLKSSRRLKFIIADHIGLGLSYEGMGDYDKAIEHFKKAIELIGKQWTSLTLSARKNFLLGKVGAGFSRLEPFEGMIRVLIKQKGQGYEEKSLLYAERIKSRTLLEMISTRGIFGKSLKDKKILEKDRTFQKKIYAQRKKIETIEALLYKVPEEERKRLKEELKEAKQELERLKEEYEAFINETKLKAPEVASLITEDVISLRNLKSLLDPDTTLLEYYTAKDKLYAWLITKETTKVYELPIKKKTLEKEVNRLLLPNISNKPRRPEPLIVIASDEYKKETTPEEIKKNRERFYQVAVEMYKQIMAPIEKNLKTKKLIIVPHGMLHKVPFSALTDGKEYLINKYAICVIPSASVMKYIVKKRNPDKGKLVAFANPTTDYVPLGFAEIEAIEIAKQFEKKEIYTKESATETIAKNKAPYPDVLHFAVHGEFNEKQPMQSCLVLARDKENDGYLQVHEIYGLDLREANLVTLSACETGVSRITGGDDLVGLSRGFIYAGTPSLLATLWEVDDKSTAIVMERFYENWRKKGMSKPEALRQAQLALKDIPKYRHPYYWAPFVMIGDWR